MSGDAAGAGQLVTGLVTGLDAQPGSDLPMPASLLERARLMLDAQPGSFEIAVARPAATVVLLRPVGRHFEVLLQRRTRSMAFAPLMHVFPGGVVEDFDHERARLLGSEHSRMFGDEHAVCGQDVGDCFGQDVLPARVAAVRETAEETGYEIGDPRSLDYVAHWVTPEVEPRRYDTRFYATVIGAVGPPPATTTEVDSAHWIRPDAALAEFRQGRMAMLPPTAAVLGRFAECLADGLSAHESIARAGADVVQPLLPVPRRESSSPVGITWVLVDARTREPVDLTPAS